MIFRPKRCRFSNLKYLTLFPESPSQIPNLPHTKPLYLYSALYNEHQKLRRTAKEVSKNI